MGYPEIHLYGQEAWHDNAYIVATREGLEKLKELVDKAIAEAQSNHEVMTGDGEDYTLHVIQVHPKDMEKLVTPYTSEYAQDNREKYRPIYPHNYPS